MNRQRTKHNLTPDAVTSDAGARLERVPSEILLLKGGLCGHAVSVGASLVTNNEADFKDYAGLVVENRVSATNA